MEISNLGTFLKHVLLLYCTFYTDSPRGSNNAVARHVNLAQITSLHTVHPHAKSFLIVTYYKVLS